MEFNGRLSGTVPVSPGKARRGSHEPQPPQDNGASLGRSWQELDDAARQAQPALQSLRELMKQPASSTGYDISRQLKSTSWPSFVGIRVGAQGLQTAVINDLHQENLPGALENLEALSGFVALNAEDPWLVSYMMRMAILGLSLDAYWDALQSPEWTEAQLTRLQQTCTGEAWLAQLPKVFAAERAIRVVEFKWLRSHSYEDWMSRYEPIYKSFGNKPPACDTGIAVRRWRQWMFHPLWRFAWADQEELHFLRSAQGELAILREAVQRKSWAHLDQQLTLHRRDYRPPAACWRFYITLPLLERMSDIVGTPPTLSGYPYGSFSRAWLTTLKHLTQLEMVKTVIALKRYKLRHGQWPETLDALTPEFIPAPPRDLMDGQVLRYRRQSEGGFILYSVGKDGKDDGGDPTPAASLSAEQKFSPWEGLDYVWPQVVAGAPTQ